MWVSVVLNCFDLFPHVFLVLVDTWVLSVLTHSFYGLRSPPHARHGTVRELYTVTHCCTVALSSVLRLNPWITLYFHLESTFVIDSYKEADWLFHFRQFGRKEQFYTLIWFYVHTFDYNAMNLMSLCMRKLQKFPKKNQLCESLCL